MFLWWLVFAANQLRDNLRSQNSLPNSTYNTPTRIVTDGDISIIDRDADGVWEGDYFLWFYLDDAYGRFDMSSINRPQITAWAWWICSPGYTSRNIIGEAISPIGGIVNFGSISIPWARNSVYICLPNNPIVDSAYLMGFAYSPVSGFQSFEWITLAGSIEAGNNDADSRRLKVIGLASSQIVEDTLGDQFVSDVKVFGNISKTDLRTLMRKNVQSVSRNIVSTSWNLSITWTQLASNTWWSITSTTRLKNNTVLYTGKNNGELITLSGTDTLSPSSQKTLVVEWGNVYISWNIRGSGILGIIVLQKNNKGGNIYIDQSVTDIHAFLYVDRSLISYNGTSELDGNTPDTLLANQLYIKWVLFSENTIGGSVKVPVVCPFYTSCATENEARKYDLNYTRRYQIAEILDMDGNPTWVQEAVNGWSESYMWNNTRNNTPPQRWDLREFPVILEYDTRIIQTPPPLFSN